MFVTKNYVFKHDNLTKKYNNKKYRITSALKVETDIIPSIKASPIGRPGLLEIIYVETFKTHVGV